MNFPLPINMLSASSPQPAGPDTVHASHEPVPAAAFWNALRGTIPPKQACLSWRSSSRFTARVARRTPQRGQEPMQARKSILYCSA